jgi:hypothetical protein
MVIVTGECPHENVITPPAATAATTAAAVQLAGVPLPTTRSGCDVSTALAAAGIVALPLGLPYRGMVGDAEAVTGGVVFGRLVRPAAVGDD